MEHTYVMIKPDGVQRGLVGTILAKFEQKGYQISAMKMMTPSKELLAEHYGDLSTRSFFPSLLAYMQSAPVVGICLSAKQGSGLVKNVRAMLGATKPSEAEQGTIRSMYAIDIGRNIIHASDSDESAKKELELWFGKDGVFEYKRAIDAWIYE